MDLPIRLTNPAAPFQPGLPSESSQILGAASFHACWEEGLLCLHKITGGGFTLWHSQHNVTPGNRLQVALSAPLLSLHLALEGAYSCQQPCPGQSLEKGQFQLRYLPKGDFTVLADAAEATCVDLLLPPYYLQLFSPQYPVLSPFLQRVAEGEAALLVPRPLTTSRTMAKRVQQLLNNPFQDGLRHLYFDAQVMELLLEVLEIATGHVATIPPVREDELERIQAVRQLLDAEPQRRFTVAQLARKAHMNVVKLNQGFRLLTGTTLFDYHLARRMEKARELLETTRMLLDDIALETGYEHLSSFIAAFKAIHGMTPATYRRSKGN